MVGMKEDFSPKLGRAHLTPRGTWCRWELPASFQDQHFVRMELRLSIARSPSQGQRCLAGPQAQGSDPPKARSVCQIEHEVSSG